MTQHEEIDITEMEQFRSSLYDYYTGEKIKPECGKLIFFPANWTYTYNSTMPISGDKYFISGWMKSIEGEDF